MQGVVTPGVLVGVSSREEVVFGVVDALLKSHF
jgi:hypothetical protein